MIRASCKDCVHFREAPYDAPRTGCWHDSHMKVTQKEAFLDEQRQPGDQRRINLRGDCSDFEARPTRRGLWSRMLRRGA